MKSYTTYLGIALMALVLGCASRNTQNTAQQNKQAYDHLKQLVDSKKFTITSNQALPVASGSLNQLSNSGLLGIGNTAASINIIGHTNYLTIKGDSVFGFLPFFGEQRFGGDYPGNTHLGIEFKDVPKNYQVSFDENKLKADLSFNIRDQYRNQESYTVYITLYPNLKSDLRVISSTRSSMGYYGYVEPLEEEAIN